MPDGTDAQGKKGGKGFKGEEGEGRLRGKPSKASPLG